MLKTQICVTRPLQCVNIKLLWLLFVFTELKKSTRRERNEFFFLDDMKGHAVLSNGAVKTGRVIVFAGVVPSFFVCAVMFVPVRNQTQRSALQPSLNMAGLSHLFA